jgi:serine/threonine protein kinase
MRPPGSAAVPPPGSNESDLSSVPSDPRSAFATDLPTDVFALGVAPFDPSIPDHVFARLAPAGGTEAARRDAPRPRDDRRSVSRDPELPSEGAIIDKYRLEELLGIGGFAAVYRATHLLLRTPVALKMLRPRVLRRRPEFADALCEEARFAARINHPNVVKVFDVTHSPKITFFVMEYIEGAPLSRLIHRDGVLSPRAALEVGRGVALGLQAGLEQGLIHRDIKPSNLILAAAGGTKIVDLGLAASSTPREQAPEGAAPRSVVGTHGYMSPEALSDEPVDFRTDIYSLGVTLYHAVIGRLPFPNDDVVLSARLHREAPPPLPHRVRPDLPLPVSELLSWMLAKRPAERANSYDELIGAILSALGSLGHEPGAGDEK